MNPGDVQSALFGGPSPTWSISSPSPLSPLSPVDPVTPVTPVVPVCPTGPVAPVTPVTPVAPSGPLIGPTSSQSLPFHTCKCPSSSVIKPSPTSPPYEGSRPEMSETEPTIFTLEPSSPLGPVTPVVHNSP